VLVRGGSEGKEEKRKKEDGEYYGEWKASI
jgi:hypothetical protein